MTTQQQPQTAEDKRRSPDPPGKRKQAVRHGSLAGQLVRDPDLRYTSEGRPVAIMRMAVSQRVQDPASGEWTDTPPDFFDVKAWGQLAENAVNCLEKGQRVIARGHWTDESWTDKQGYIQVRQVLTARDVGPSLLWGEARFQPSNGKTGTS